MLCQVQQDLFDQRFFFHHIAPVLSLHDGGSFFLGSEGEEELLKGFSRRRSFSRAECKRHLTVVNGVFNSRVISASDISRMYYEAIKWALGLTDADVTPRPLPAGVLPPQGKPDPAAPVKK